MIYLDHAAATPRDAYETNQRFFSSHGAKNAIFAPAALFQRKAQR